MRIGLEQKSRNIRNSEATIVVKLQRMRLNEVKLNATVVKLNVAKLHAYLICA